MKIDEKDLLGISERFIQIVREYQLRTGLKQKDVALQVGYNNPAGFSIVMSGRQKPSLNNIQKLAMLTGVSEVYIRTGMEIEDKDAEIAKLKAEVARLKTELGEANEKIETLYKVVQKLTI